MKRVLYLLFASFILAHDVEETLANETYKLNYCEIPSFINYNVQKDNNEEHFWSVWSAGYSRSAYQVYSCDGRYKLPLTVLFLGKSCFQLREAFADSIVTIPSNPWVTVSTLCPLVDYTERGAQIGLEFSKDTHFRSRNFRVGIRSMLPIKTIKVSRRYSSQDIESEVNNIDSVRRLSTEVITPGTPAVDNSFAYRMDFLSTLAINNEGEPLIDYTQAPLLINAIDVTDNNSSPVNLVKRIDTTPPATPFAAVNTSVDGYSFLDANGSNLSNNQRGRFKSSTSYEPLSLNVNNQEQLWLVPTVTWDGSSYNITADANTIRNVVENIVNQQIGNSVVDYMTAKGISLGTQYMSGLGDLSTQLFLVWVWPETDVWTELNCAFVFPTGKKQNCPYNVFACPLGNNGHVEIGPGIDFGWYAMKWLSLRAACNYNFVLGAYEPVAAPFCGACVKNIGPCIPAHISWQYLNVDVDMNIVEPTTKQFGFNLGYNFYFKRCDNIYFNVARTDDFEDNSQILDPRVLSRLTRQIAHKLRGELFFTKSFGSIYGGFSYIVHGKNIPIESAAYVGLMITF